jgi:hypothetical protein
MTEFLVASFVLAAMPGTGALFTIAAVATTLGILSPTALRIGWPSSESFFSWR